MKRLLLLAALLLCWAACGVTDSAPAGDIASHLKYFRDPKTKICFAAVGSRTYAGYTVTAITAVPCSALGLKEDTP